MTIEINHPFLGVPLETTISCSVHVVHSAQGQALCQLAEQLLSSEGKEAAGTGGRLLGGCATAWWVLMPNGGGFEPRVAGSGENA